MQMFRILYYSVLFFSIYVGNACSLRKGVYADRKGSINVSFLFV